jgi:hypothetical protein
MKPLFKQSINPAQSLIIIDENGGQVQLTVENFLKLVNSVVLDNLTVTGLTVQGNIFVSGTTVSNWDSTAKQTVYHISANNLPARYNIDAVSYQIDLSDSLVITTTIPTGARVIGASVYVDEAITTDTPATIALDYSAGITGPVLPADLTGTQGEASSSFVDQNSISAIVTGSEVELSFSPSTGNITGGLVTVVLYYELLPVMEP